MEAQHPVSSLRLVVITREANCWSWFALFHFQVPSKSPFAAPLERMQRLLPLMEEEVAASEEVLTDLLDKLSDMVRESLASQTRQNAKGGKGWG